MDRLIVIHIENRFLKGILLKSIAQAGFGVIDVMDADDLALKMEAFGQMACLVILEITDWNMNAVQVEIDRIKGSPFNALPVMAVVSKDTADVVTFAMKAGIRDILLLPKQRELYRKTVSEKMNTYYQKLTPPAPEKPKEPNLFEELLENPNIKETLQIEIMHAQRGGYPLSLVMAHLAPEGEDFAKRLFYRVKGQLRAIDKVLLVNEETLIGILPFTQKKHAPVVEQKIREAFDIEKGREGALKRLHLFSATFPDDETNLDLLLERLENGVNNSIVINTIRSPLNALSKAELESYKQKIRQYRKFF